MMSFYKQGRKEGRVRSALGRRAFPQLIGLLQIIPNPRWAAPTLVFLGILSSFAEAAGIALVPLFFYSMMKQLDLVALNGGLLGAALRYTMRQFHGSRGIALVLLLLILIRGVLAYAYAIATAHISEQMSQTTRNRVHDQYLRLPYHSIQQHEQAELAQILGHEAWLLSIAYTSLTRIFVNTTFIVILGCLLAVFSWKLMLCALFGSLLLFAVLRLLSARARAIGTEVKRVHRDMWDHMMVTLQGMRTIRAFGQEDTHQRRFEVSSTAAREVDLKGMQLTLILDPLTEVGYLAILGVIIMGAPSMSVSFATALTCVALLYRLQPHVRELEAVRLKLLQLEPQLHSVRSILEAEVKDRGASGDVPIQNIMRGIRFEGVSFAYTEGGPRALDQSTFEIPAGVTTALVGASGSGKTTVVNLLLGLYAPDSGVIYVDDTPIEALRRTDWLKLMAVAGQDVDLIDGTVLENIKMADIHASDQAVAAALEMVGISELMESLPDGYNTWVGHQGQRFSGGQRQRIGLARAALHNPKFLILDEAMNAMDLALEQRVRRAIDLHFEGCTILLITHRLETVLNSAHVVWIDDGRIIAEGKPSDMLLDDESALSKALAAVL